MAQLNGRVFTRLQQYTAQPTELKHDVQALEQYLTAAQGAIFGSHRTLKLKAVYGVRKQALVEKIEAWVKTHDHSKGHGYATGRTVRTHAHMDAAKLLDALVLKGFVTPYKEDKLKDAPTDGAVDLDFKDNELFVARSESIAVAKEVGPSVWELIDGAIFAGMIKRKAGLLEPLTHGKDTYAIVNARLRNLTLFKTDLSVKPIMQFGLHSLHVSYDRSHYDHGVKIWNETDTELLNTAGQAESDALVEALMTAGASQSGGYGHGRGHSATTDEKLCRDARKAVGADHHDHRDDKYQRFGEHTATYDKQTKVTEAHPSDVVHGSHHLPTTTHAVDETSSHLNDHSTGHTDDKLHGDRSQQLPLQKQHKGLKSDTLKDGSARGSHGIDGAHHPSMAFGSERTTQRPSMMQKDKQLHQQYGMLGGAVLVVVLLIILLSTTMFRTAERRIVPYRNQPGSLTCEMTQQQHQHHSRERLGLGGTQCSALHGNQTGYTNATNNTQHLPQQQHDLATDNTKRGDGEPRGFTQLNDSSTCPK